VSIPTAVGRQAIELLPSSTRLLQNFPNPFNPSTTISYIIGERAQVTLKVFDVLGAEVATLVSKVQDPGSYQVSWDGRNSRSQEVISGIYFYRLQAGSFSKTEKMVLVK
jgi:flagellar hook assembly protein FlgD